MKRIFVTLYLMALASAVSLVAFSAPPQMTDTCADGKIVAIDATNKRYKCIVVPIVLDSINVNLTGQGAAIGSTLLYAVPSNGAGLYKITWVATITRAASVSSALGGTGLGLQTIYTNSDDSTLITTPANLSGAVNIANLVGTPAYGEVIIYAKASTNINYQIGYTSVGATTMQYSLHIRLESLQ